MIDFNTPNEALPVWHWHAERRDESAETGQFVLIDEGSWTAESPEHVARFIGWQLTDQDITPWRVSLWRDRCSSEEPVLTYTNIDHGNWLSNLSDDDETLLAIKAAARADNEPQMSRGTIVDFLRAAGIDVPSDRSPDQSDPIGHLDFHTPASDTLKYFERLIGEDGEIDRRRVLADVGDLLFKAIGEVVRHCIAAHPGEPWTDCPESLAAVSRVAATFTSAAIMVRFES